MIEDLQRIINQQMHERNSRAIPEFEGYSPNEMTHILYWPFKENSPLEISSLEKQDYDRIPMLKQIHYLAEMLREQGEMKLTQKGFLPTKVVAELCRQEFLMNERLEIRLERIKESDSMSATLTRFIMELAGLTKKRNNKLSLTKAGEKLLAADDKLLRKVLEAYCNKFNWAYFDNYEGEQVGRFGFVFTFILLSKYGSQKRPDRFYAEKYFEAFPRLIDESFKPPFDDVRTYNYKAYSVRTFNRFLAFFGLVEIEQEKWDAEKFIRKTDLFDKLIKIRKHNSRPAAG